MVKKMLLTLVVAGGLSANAYAEIDYSYRKDQTNSQENHNRDMQRIKNDLSRRTLSEQQQFEFYIKQNLSTGYIIPSADRNKTTAYNVIHSTLFNKEIIKDSEFKPLFQKILKIDPHFNKMFELYAKPTPLSQSSPVINIFDDGSGKSDFVTKRNVEKVTPKIEEYAKDYASKVFVHVATRGADGEIVYMTPQQRKDFIHSAYMAGAMKLDNETVAKLDGKYPLEVEDVAQIRNGICIALKRRDLLKHLNGCDVNKPLTTQDYVKSGATRLAIEWGTNGKTAISADSRMKGVSIQKTIRVDPRVLDKLLNSK